MKKLTCMLLVLVLLLSFGTSVIAAEQPLIYEDTIIVTKDGGRFQIGFVNIEFKKDFIEPDTLPVTFNIKIYAENGLGYIEFIPDTTEFSKKVHIRVDAYDGLLYDVAKKENIEISIKKQQILVDHFSRYCFAR